SFPSLSHLSMTIARGLQAIVWIERSAYLNLELHALPTRPPAPSTLPLASHVLIVMGWCCSVKDSPFISKSLLNQGLFVEVSDNNELKQLCGMILYSRPTDRVLPPFRDAEKREIHPDEM